MTADTFTAGDSLGTCTITNFPGLTLTGVETQGGSVTSATLTSLDGSISIALVQSGSTAPGAFSLAAAGGTVSLVEFGRMLDSVAYGGLPTGAPFDAMTLDTLTVTGTLVGAVVTQISLSAILTAAATTCTIGAVTLLAPRATFIASGTSTGGAPQRTTTALAINGSVQQNASTTIDNAVLTLDCLGNWVLSAALDGVNTTLPAGQALADWLLTASTDIDGLLNAYTLGCVSTWSTQRLQANLNGTNFLLTLAGTSGGGQAVFANVTLPDGNVTVSAPWVGKCDSSGVNGDPDVQILAPADLLGDNAEAPPLDQTVVTIQELMLTFSTSDGGTLRITLAGNLSMFGGALNIEQVSIYWSKNMVGTGIPTIALTTELLLGSEKLFPLVLTGKSNATTGNKWVLVIDADLADADLDFTDAISGWLDDSVTLPSMAMTTFALDGSPGEKTLTVVAGFTFDGGTASEQDFQVAFYLCSEETPATKMLCIGPFVVDITLNSNLSSAFSKALGTLSISGINIIWANDPLKATPTTLLPYFTDIPKGFSLGEVQVDWQSNTSATAPQASRVRPHVPKAMGDGDPPAANQPAATKQAPVQQNFDGAEIQSLQLSYADKAITISVTGSYSMMNISAGLIDLDLTVGLSPVSFGMSLSGLALSCNQPKAPMGFAGVIDWNGGGGDIEAYGLLDLYFHPKLTMRAGAIIADSDGTPGGFGFAALSGINVPLGSFTMTGAAVAVGVGMTLEVPAPADISTFPLIGVLDGTVQVDVTNLAASYTTTFANLASIAPGGSGTVGLKGTTAGLIDVTALLNVQWDPVLVDLFGQATFAQPRGAAPADRTSMIVMGFDGEWNPTAGQLSVTAEIQPGSFLFQAKTGTAGASKLSGGGAIYCWYAGPEAGQFVITVGGYAPSYQVPTYFPSVPRLTSVSSFQDSSFSQTMSGQAYAALTSDAFMVGGSFAMELSANWRGGAVSFCANLNLSFDALIGWAPFYYEVDIAISLSLSLTIQVKVLVEVTLSLSLTLGATLTIMGPPAYGIGAVYVHGLSIPFQFGTPPTSASPTPLQWSEMVQQFLVNGNGATQGALAAEDNAPTPLSIVVTAGAAGGASGSGAETVLPNQLAFTIASTVPVLDFLWSGGPEIATPTVPTVTIPPMGKGTLTSSQLAISLSPAAGVEVSWFDAEVVVTDAPAALWMVAGGSGPTSSVPTALAVAIEAQPADLAATSPVTLTTLLAANQLTGTAKWQTATVPTSDDYGDDDPASAFADLTASAPLKTLVGQMAALGLPVSPDMVNMTGFAPGTEWRSAPLLRTVGEIQAQAGAMQ